jgi:hypothetical protein
MGCLLLLGVAAMLNDWIEEQHIGADVWPNSRLDAVRQILHDDEFVTVFYSFALFLRATQMLETRCQ